VSASLRATLDQFSKRLLKEDAERKASLQEEAKKLSCELRNAKRTIQALRKQRESALGRVKEYKSLMNKYRGELVEARTELNARRRAAIKEQK
jgi:CHASE3 domain sensor protein